MCSFLKTTSTPSPPSLPPAPPAPELVTPDPWIAMEIGNWAEREESVEFPGAGAGSSYCSYFLLLLLLLNVLFVIKL